MMRALSRRAVVVLGTVLGGALLLFAVSSQADTVGQARSEDGKPIHEYEVEPQLAAVGFRSPPIWFRYRHWRVFGLDVWTWDGKYFTGDKERGVRENWGWANPPQAALEPF